VSPSFVVYIVVVVLVVVVVVVVVVAVTVVVVVLVFVVDVRVVAVLVVVLVVIVVVDTVLVDVVVVHATVVFTLIHRPPSEYLPLVHVHSVSSTSHGVGLSSGSSHRGFFVQESHGSSHSPTGVPPSPVEPDDCEGVGALGGAALVSRPSTDVFLFLLNIIYPAIPPPMIRKITSAVRN